MKRYIAAGAFTIALVLGATAPAYAASGSGSGRGGESIVRGTCNVALPCSAGAAGTVSVARSGANLTVTAVSPAAGWRVVGQRITGLSVEVEFRNGGTRISWQAEVEDGIVVTKIRTRAV